MSLSHLRTNEARSVSSLLKAKVSEAGEKVAVKVAIH